MAMTFDKTRVVILGSTGSIGVQALEVVFDNPGQCGVIGISANGSKPELLLEQAQKVVLRAERVAVASDRTADFVEAQLGGHCSRGQHSARDLVEALGDQLESTDVILNALVGSQV